MLVLLLPLVLIFLNTGLGTLATAKVIDGDALWVNILRMAGQTPVALLITVLVGMWTLSGQRARKDMEKLMDGALGPVCGIILVTGAGDMFGGVLRASGIGQALAGSLEAVGMPRIVAAFLIFTALRVAQGSATVALTTTAGLLAPTIAATVLSHVNDSGFWLVGRFLQIDERTTLQTWTVTETLGSGLSPASGGGKPRKHFWQNLIAACVSLGWNASFFAMSLALPAGHSRGDVGPGALPMEIAIFGMVVSAIYFVQVLRGHALGGADEKVDVARVACLLGLFVAVALSANWIGLALGLGVGSGVATLLFPGTRPLVRAVATGIGFWAIAYVLFGMLLELPLP